MFTLEQIQNAHSKVKSGADFPAYIQDLKKLGLTHYESFVEDGHAEFFGINNFKISSPVKYYNLPIAKDSNSQQFKLDLKSHQEGKTDYLTFCKDCANSGVEKWQVSIEKMTCTYFDLQGNEILMEQIPS
ncbi:MAG: DUF1398 family protein [Bacteroidota bacterium]